jgi:hypothetical protein
MKKLLALLCALGMVSATTRSQDAATSPAAYYATLTRQTFELEAQRALLNELAQELSKRAAEAPADQAAVAKCENDLAKELSERASAVLARLNECTKQRQAFEETHAAELPNLKANGTAGATNGPNADGIAYQAGLDDRIERARQELAAAVDQGKLYTSQLLTNKSQEEFARISGLLQDNTSHISRLEKEQSDLELRKLEYRALRHQ